MTTPDPAEEARRNHRAMYPKKPARRRGTTPEAKVSAAIDTYLKQLGFLTMRTHAGQLKDAAGHTIYLGKRGQSDRVCCIPEFGLFCAIEIKATTDTTPAQDKYLARVAALGGLAIVARSRADVRAALVARFGEAVVSGWERRAT